MEQTQKTSFYKAILAKDLRYDGRFFYGVKTTGIYCRPICPAKPKMENIEFFKSQTEAEAAGYRPCLRCRPDASPLSSLWVGTKTVLSRALRVLENIDHEGGDMKELPSRLGMTDRHLRRLFREHLGTTPTELIRSRRLHLARQLLLQTSLSVLDISNASGFRSQRRFHDAFQKAYKITPTNFRKMGREKTPNQEIYLKFPYVGEYDWDSLLAFLKRHETYSVEHIDEESYQRFFVVNDELGFYRVSHSPKDSSLHVQMSLPSLKELRRLVGDILSI